MTLALTATQLIEWWNQGISRIRRLESQRQNPPPCDHGPGCLRCKRWRYNKKAEAADCRNSLERMHRAIAPGAPVCDGECAHVAAGLSVEAADELLVSYAKQAARTHQRWMHRIDSESAQEAFDEAWYALQSFAKFVGRPVPDYKQYECKREERQWFHPECGCDECRWYEALSVANARRDMGVEAACDFCGSAPVAFVMTGDLVCTIHRDLSELEDQRTICVAYVYRGMPRPVEDCRCVDCEVHRELDRMRERGELERLGPTEDPA